MNKFITLLACFLFGHMISYSQTLLQPANWPNGNWTVPANGYTPNGFIKDPRTTANFSFDDDAAGLASIDNIWAASPAIDLTAAFNASETTIEVSFVYIFTSNTNADNIQLQYFDTDLATWVVWDPITPDPLATTAAYRTCTEQIGYTSTALDISGFTATQLSGFKYRLNYNDNGGWEFGFCINSPTIRSIVTCLKPTNLTANNITASSADLGWTENNGATSWDIEIVSSGTTPTGTPTVAATNTNPHTVSGLSASTSYDFYVLADCGGGNGKSAWSGPFTFTTSAPPCSDPSNLASGNETSSSAELSWTENGTAALWDIEILTSGGTPSGTPSQTGVANPYSAQGLSASTAYDFYVRADCGSGNTSSWIGPFTFNTTAPPCTNPSDLGAINISSSGAELFWTENGTANLWDIEIVNSGTTASGTPSQSGISNPYAAQGLSASTAYDFYVRADCGGGNTSLWSGPFTFTTLEDCPEPSSLGAVNITSTSADLVWQENGSSTSWDIELILTGTTPSGVATANSVSMPHSATGLSPSTTYDFYVRSGCSSTSSIWVGPYSFTTSSGANCDDPTDLGAMNIGDTEAGLFWTENGLANLWDIELVTSGTTATGTPTSTDVTNPTTVSSLSPGIAYEYYVRSNCGGSYSNWVGPYAFNTTANLHELQEINFEVYPNPNNGEFSIKGSWTEKIEISIFDVKGALIFTKESINQELSIDIRHAESGLYMVQVKTGSMITHRRIIIE